jgi:transposase-like protein
LLEFRCPDCKKSFTIEDPNDREYRNQKGNSDQ